jgi:hypothetical protein
MLNKLSFTRMRNVSAALVFSLSLAASAAASQPQAIRIDNFGRVDATLYRGARRQATTSRTSRRSA